MAYGNLMFDTTHTIHVWYIYRLFTYIYHKINHM